MKFNTIKTKITLILTGITIVYYVVILTFGFTYFNKSRALILESYKHKVSQTAQALNTGIITVEDNALDLAIAGNIFIENKIPEKTMHQYLIDDLIHYKEPVGAGIWFEPYVINPNEKYHSFYVMRNKAGQIIMKDLWDTENYDYLNKAWYKRTITGVSPKKKIIWGLSKGDYTEFKSLITASAGVYDNQDNLVGISEVDWDFDACVELLKNINPTKNSFILFADKKNDFVFFSTDPYMDSNEAVGKSLNDIPWYNNKTKDKSSFIYNNVRYVSFIETLDNGMSFIVNIPEMDMLKILYLKVILLIVIMASISSFLIAVLYFILNSDIMKPIGELISVAHKISSGDTSAQIKIEKPEEFAMLASTYDKMTNNIKEFTKNQTKMNYELSVANSIQISSLPNIFPPFPEHKEFSIYAMMEPAREVGGDFYDFFFKDSDHLMFLVADVSGKGVPAALFMMTVKTLINNISQTISSPEELIQTINRKIHSNNKEQFFLTMFACIIDIHTGKMTCLNCGHNPPLIKKDNGQYEYLDLDPNMILGIFKKINDFQVYETTLHAGDTIMLYTDGVTEAVNSENELYGEKRLKDCMNSIGHDVPIDQITKLVKENVKGFTKGHSQNDDATILLFQYLKTVKSFKRTAVRENYKEYSTWIRTNCAEWDLNKELSNKVDMCGEEIFANICFYAYPEETGDIKLSMEKNDKELIMTFIDSGIMYNPLEKPDPDITIPPRERQLGGLGIYMVKQMTKDMQYQRKDNKNILTLKFDIY